MILWRMAVHTKTREILRTCPQCGTAFVTGSSAKIHCMPACRVLSLGAGRAPDECWTWPGSVNPGTGYGQLSEWRDGERTVYTAHRVSFEASVGPIPDGMSVLHRCDNRACFNPRHLFTGTQRDNVLDMVAKGRQRSVPAAVHWSALHPERVPRGDAHHLRRAGTDCLPRGEACGHAKVTEQDVRAIRASDETLAVLASRFGVSQVAVSKIRRGLTWRHVT